VIHNYHLARDFYQNTLGLRLVMEGPPFALVFEANGIMLRLGMAKKLPPAHGTVLGWQVPKVAAIVRQPLLEVVTFICLGFWDLATLPNKSFVS
jgi:catechol 2,3-dioxygenase-like lactoylglutathione lyase family enzyme